MAYESTAINNIALILIIVSVIKMLVLLVKPAAWMNFGKNVFKNKALAQIIGLVIAGVVLYYLNDAGISIVTILAVIAFLGGLLLVGLAGYVEDIITKYDAQIKRGNLWKENWLYALLWIALLVWGAKELFAL